MSVKPRIAGELKLMRFVMFGSFMGVLRGKLLLKMFVTIQSAHSQNEFIRLALNSYSITNLGRNKHGKMIASQKINDII